MATMMDVEMVTEKKEEKKVSIDMMRKKFEEWDVLPYHHQMWNKICYTWAEGLLETTSLRPRVYSDVYIFGLVLLQLIANEEVICDGPDSLEQRAIKEAKRGEKYLVRDYFKEVDHSTAFKITLLAFRCLHIDPSNERPKMEEVLNALTELRDEARGEKQKRDEKRGRGRESEFNNCYRLSMLGKIIYIYTQGNFTLLHKISY
ncbi:hypothetical protein CQW23_16310 [Capsicum baccatum]|uniref:Protein kinase domain-containing protein n=1 Tax=Capsicum baccatum TaxID=33114 RepID=A0A2G2WAL7_CAPBA|nr:hypothetical protein CQW23_16310 [Capsicum baccatum]